MYEEKFRQKETDGPKSLPLKQSYEHTNNEGKVNADCLGSNRPSAHTYRR